MANEGLTQAWKYADNRNIAPLAWLVKYEETINFLALVVAQKPLPSRRS